MNPSAVATTDSASNSKGSADRSEVPVTVLLPGTYPSLWVSIVAIDSVWGASPVTVISPVSSSIETSPPAVAVPDQSKAASKLVIWAVKPSAVATASSMSGVSAASSASAVASAVPVTKSVRLADTVTVASAPASTPVTVTSPVPSTSAEPAGVTPVTAKVKALLSVSKFVIWTVKPVAVRVGSANVGVSGAWSDVKATVALPPSYPSRVVVMVAVDAVFAANPLTVTTPVSDTVTMPPAVAVPAQSKALS